MEQSESCRNTLWQKRAVAFAVRTRQEMWGKHSADIQATMFMNGFSMEYMKEALLGWHHKPVFRKLESWGVEPAGEGDEGKPDRFAIPVGIVVPCVVDSFLRKLSVITFTGEEFGPVFTLPGSCMESVIFGSGKKQVAVVENLADALLLHQEAGERLDVLVPELSTDGRPDRRAAELLEAAEKILLITDSEQASGQDKEFFSGLSLASPEVVPLKGGVVQAFKNGVSVKEL